jgi:hypothetical protein
LEKREERIISNLRLVEKKKAKSTIINGHYVGATDAHTLLGPMIRHKSSVTMPKLSYMW